MKKHLISRDTDKINGYMSLLNKTLPLIQNVIDEIKTIGVDVQMSDIINLLGLIFRSESDKRAIECVENFLREKLIQGVSNPQIAGIKISKEKLLEMVEIPDCKPIVTCVYKLRSIIGIGRENLNLNFYTVTDGIVCVSSSAIENVTEMFSIYIDAGKAWDIYNATKSIVDGLNLFDEKCTAWEINDKYKIKDYLPFLNVRVGGEWDIDYNFLSQYGNK